MLGATVLQNLKLEISEVEYNRYIKQLKYNEKLSKSDILVYEAPNIIIANYVKTKFSKKIAVIYESINQIKPRVIINIKTKLKSVKKPNISNDKTATNTILNPSFTFDNFMVGNSNQLAFTTAKKAASEPGLHYNPLLIYGGTGLGKTHLLQAIGNYSVNKGLRVIYVTSEQFMNDFIYHIRNHTQDRFREKYRDCDMLLVDDVQFFSNKTETQEEFFNTFNELHQHKKQIILTSDKPPKQIIGLEERLRSRFEMGLNADIKAPELETKKAIIIKKCELNRITIDNEVIDYMASKLGENVREIEGAIINLNASSTIINKPITLELAKDVLKDLLKEKTQNLTIEDILETISKELNVKPSEIKSKNRTKKIADARAIVIYLSKELTSTLTTNLAKYFSLKDHSAISKAITKVNKLIDEDANYKLIVEELKNKITTKT